MRERRVAIVTGASSGIGRALAERAVRAGWDVFAVGRRAERLDELGALLVPAIGRITTLALDLRAPGAPARIVRETLARYGRIDVLVNNAGGVAVGPIAEQSDEALHEALETHVIVPLALTREALPSLRASHGLVIYFGSGVARVPVGALGAYPPAKAAVRSLARVARNELRPSGIAVTYVDPGAVATEFMTRVGFAGPPPGIAASPYDVARAVFAAFESRKPVVNAVPWQTFFVALGEAFPAVTDFVLSRAPVIIGGDTLPSRVVEPHVLPASDVSETPVVTAAPMTLPGPALEPEPVPAPEATPQCGTEGTAPSTYEEAIAPHASRMRKLNLKDTFVRDLLVLDAELDLGSVALRWAGMPNKNERGLTHDILEALANAGYLERLESEHYRVLRAATA